jgi:hypothetical protein
MKADHHPKKCDHFSIRMALIVILTLISLCGTMFHLAVPISRMTSSSSGGVVALSSQYQQQQPQTASSTVKGVKGKQTSTKASRNVKVVLTVDTRDYCYSATAAVGAVGGTEHLLNTSATLQVVAGINARYANLMGYEFVWYKVLCPNGESCKLDNSSRLRAPGWARVLALNETLAYYSQRGDNATILYLDSDAYVSNHSIPMLEFEASASIWEDEIPLQFCSGTMMWRNSRIVHQVLSDRWRFNETLEYDLSRQWEQAVLNLDLMHKYREEIQKLPSLGWATPNHVAWDSGFLKAYLAPSNRTIYHDMSFNLTVADLESNQYVSYIQHMWGGLHTRYIDILHQDFKRLNGSLLFQSDFYGCDLSTETSEYWQRLCLK